MNCPKCRKEIDGELLFCGYCGFRLDKEDTVNIRNVSDEQLHEQSIEVEGMPHETVLVGKSKDEEIVSSSSTILVNNKQVGVPEKFGRYRVIKQIGRGSMGIVYLARDDKIGRNVAIKVLSLNPGLSPEDAQEASERFEREARAAGMLTNPNIVTIYDVGEEEDVPFIAMEYLEGATLYEIAKEAPLTPQQAVHIISQVLSALSYAHGQGIVHRDLKPDNIFLLPDGTVKVVDFGIARIGATSMTQIGQIMGTPGYMSPEQVKGETVGPASDIFSVGLILYEIVTGEKPFSSDSPTSTMYKIVNDELKPPHLTKPDIPPQLEAVITRATLKRPSKRYNSASLMREEILEADLKETQGAGVPAGGTILRSGPVAKQLPPTAVNTGTGESRVKKKKTALIAGISSLAVILAIIAVVLIVVSSGGEKTVVLEVKNPLNGKEVSGPSVEVDIEVTNSEEVDKIELYVDGEKQTTLDSSPYKATIEITEPGRHLLELSAYNNKNALLAEEKSSFVTKEAAGSAQSEPAGQAAAAADQENTTQAPASTTTGNNATEAAQNAPFYTVVIASLDQRTGHTQAEAEALAQQVRQKGLHAGVLNSVEFKSLRRPYWVVYSGIYKTQGEADAHAPAVKAAGYGDVYTRYVSFEGSGEEGPVIP